MKITRFKGLWTITTKHGISASYNYSDAVKGAEELENVGV